MRHSNFDVNTLIEYLQGTCKTLDEGVKDCFENMTEEDLTTEDHAAIDGEIFRCDDCGWWCEINEEHDLNGDQLCGDCYPENPEDYE